MTCRSIVVVSSLLIAATGLAQTTSKPDSSIQGTGSGTVVLRPTSVRLSIPIKIVDENSWNATEKLRKIRKQVVARAADMGAGDEVRTVGFQCVPEPEQRIRLNQATENTPRYAASCFVIVDLLISKMDDHEATVAVAQSQLEELAMLVPQVPPSRSLSYSTLTSGLTTQQVSGPAVFYVAPVTLEARRTATRQAIEQAKAQVDASLAALGVEMSTMAIHQQSTSYVTSRPKHPVFFEVFRDAASEAVGSHAEGVRFNVSIAIQARFEMPDLSGLSADDPP